MKLSGIHHVAIISSDYALSKYFYTRILGFEILRETFRKERNSYKLDLLVDNSTQIELFSFPDTPERMSYPEARGLRHLAFSTPDIEDAVLCLNKEGVLTEPIRIDEITGKRFTFFSDPDNLPLELYED